MIKSATMNILGAIAYILFQLGVLIPMLILTLVPAALIMFLSIFSNYIGPFLAGAIVFGVIVAIFAAIGWD